MSGERRESLEPAYVLYRRPYRDSSLIIDVFTPGCGRIGLVARGARRARSRWQPLLQLFQPLLLSWGGRGELGTLSSAEPSAAPISLQGRRLVSGLYVNELLLRLLHRNDPHPGLFKAYEAVLRELAHLPAASPPGGAPAYKSEERTLRIFEYYLLRELGYGLMLDKEAVTMRPIEPNALYHYVPETGPLLCRDGIGPPSGQAVPVHGASLRSLACEELRDPISLREIKHLMRGVLQVCLGGRPLNSRRLFRGAGIGMPDAARVMAGGEG